MSDLVPPKEFALRCWDAILRIIAIAIFGSLHWLLDKGLTYLLPENFRPAKVWIEDLAFVVFSLVDVYLLWEILKLFIPWLNPRPAAPVVIDAVEATDEANS
jgi:hypothetical protein